MFEVYLKLGWEHICDLSAFDHLLFVVIISLGIPFSEWKKLLKLLSAFTVGHSASLIYAIWYPLGISSAWIEGLIVASIGVSILLKWFRKHHLIEHWLLILFFGLIHGMGFSNYLRDLFGKSEALAEALFAFNLGLELGQITIVSIFLALQYVFLHGLKIKRSGLEFAEMSLISLAFLYILFIA